MGKRCAFLTLAFLALPDLPPTSLTTFFDQSIGGCTKPSPTGPELFSSPSPIVYRILESALLSVIEVVRPRIPGRAGLSNLYHHIRFPGRIDHRHCIAIERKEIHCVTVKSFDNVRRNVWGADASQNSGCTARCRRAQGQDKAQKG